MRRRNRRNLYGNPTSASARLFHGVLVLALLATTAACRDDERDLGWPGAAEAGEQVDSWSPEAIRISPETSLQLSEREENLMRQITSRREEILAAQPPARVLAEMELVFLMAGQLGELADYYLEAQELQGESSYLVPRLAWIYQQLGLGDRALAFALRAVEARPNDAFSHFVLGYARSSQPGLSEEERREVYESFTKMLELEPQFSIPGFVSNDIIRQQVRRLGDELDPVTGAADTAPASDSAEGGVEQENSADD